MKAKTGIVYDERCLAHDNGSMIINERARWIPVPHVESAARMTRTFQVLEGAGVLAQLHSLPGRRATRAELELVHSDALIDRVRDASASGEHAWVGPEARVGGNSWDAALVAAGGLLNAVDAVLSGEVANAYALLRPPGHHASADQAMGFCLFNNVAVGCRYAQRHHRLERVAVVDWDVHHGNGTQSVFYEDDSVLFISLHQAGLYPRDGGTVAEAGRGSGLGYTINVPLPAGAGDAAYRDAVERVVLPALRGFAPSLIFISAGQDAAASDPLGRMSVTTEGFRAMTKSVKAIAEDLSAGRLVIAQEGGYSLDHLPYCNLAVVEAAADLAGAFDTDPMELDVPDGLRPEDRSAIDAVVTSRRSFGV